ncbi:hypothetical protein ACFO6V_08555 [Promicromonospora alba]|uniref:Lipoprotein n=1 Tax=Promicromonospora alba TaxID=1616110 RepID=A0ABV9HDD0_9MICO
MRSRQGWVRSRHVLLAALGLVALVGCGGAEPTSAVKESEKPETHEWTSVSAEIKDRNVPGVVNGYGLVLSAEKRDRTGEVTAHLRGPVPEGGAYREGITFFAVARSNTGVTFFTSRELASARVEGEFVVEWCTDSEGDNTLSGCPIGDSFDVVAEWDNAGKLEEFHQKNNNLEGRLSDCRVTIEFFGSYEAEYAEIVHNTATLPARRQ